MISVLCLIPEFCPQAVGLPSVYLPQSGVTQTHLLPMMTFPCPGTISKVHYYASSEGELHLGIAEWDILMKEVKVLNIISHTINSIGEHAFDVQNGLSVKKDNFLMILADSFHPAPITYANENDLDYMATLEDLTLASSTVNISQIIEGCTFSISDENGWEKLYKTFALFVEMAVHEDSAWKYGKSN